jgi:hypothetical protein
MPKFVQRTSQWKDREKETWEAAVYLNGSPLVRKLSRSRLLFFQGMVTWFIYTSYSQDCVLRTYYMKAYISQKQ